MRLLLDTHALLWWLGDDPRLSAGARQGITDSPVVVVSAASVWEIAVKQALGKLTGPDDLEAEITANGFTALDISAGHALSAGRLPRHHEDPFDRMLIAQAMSEGLTVVTGDRRFADYDVPRLAA